MPEKKKQGNLLFPVFLKLEQLHTLVIGGGNVAYEKMHALLSNSPHAHITVVAEEWRNKDIFTFSHDYPNVILLHETFTSQHLDNKDLVICATDNPTLHRSIKSTCERQHLLCNVVDTPQMCDFYLSSIVKKGDLKIAISSNGKSPTLTKRLRVFFDEMIEENSLNTILQNLTQIRSKIKKDFNFKVNKLNNITQTFADATIKELNENE